MKITVALALLALVGFFIFRFSGPTPTEEGFRTERRSVRASKDGTSSSVRSPSRREKDNEEVAPDAKKIVVDHEKTLDDAERETEEERREAEEELLVQAFERLTDKWMRPTAKSVTMEEICQFRDQFGKIPRHRREECLQRALNLIPDENVELLVGILMDKSQDKELLTLVYNDVLNRDEDVKKPILTEIFKDREHPCWADTAWILDVTGALPKKVNSRPPALRTGM